MNILVINGSPKAEQCDSMKHLKVVEQAGREYAKTGGITEETHLILDIPMYDPKAYRKMCSGN